MNISNIDNDEYTFEFKTKVEIITRDSGRTSILIPDFGIAYSAKTKEEAIRRIPIHMEAFMKFAKERDSSNDTRK